MVLRVERNLKAAGNRAYPALQAVINPRLRYKASHEIHQGLLQIRSNLRWDFRLCHWVIDMVKAVPAQTN